MTQLLERPLKERPVIEPDARSLVEVRPSVEPPIPPRVDTRRRSVGWIGWAIAAILAVALGVLTYMVLDTDELALTGEPWTPTERGIAAVMVEPETPWTPDLRGLIVVQPAEPWNTADRGLIVVQPAEPWITADRGLVRTTAGIPWTLVDRGLVGIANDVPWTALERGIGR